jgi:hypothetical protein
LEAEQSGGMGRCTNRKGTDSHAHAHTHAILTLF